MIFESLYESAMKGELILVDGGYCRWHLRRDGGVTIYEIISMRQGAGQEMLSLLPSGHPITARCPADMTESNLWWHRRGFSLTSSELTRTGRILNTWRRHA